MVALAQSIPEYVDDACPHFDALVASLPSVAPAALVHAEVVRHPRGGWTIAQPVDATQSTIRNYEGWWARKSQAETALDGRYSA